MKTLLMTGPIVAYVLAAALAEAGTAHAQIDWRAPRVVTFECSGCHGIDGNTPLPTMPRLAGLNATYLAQQIAAFRAAPEPSSVEVPDWLVKPAATSADARTGRDAQTYMIGPAHALSAEDEKEATAWYARQKPAHGQPGNPVLVSKGRELYAKGDPAAGIVPPGHFDIPWVNAR